MQSVDRLRRLLDDELEECRDEDVENRLAELETLADGIPTDPSPDIAALATLGDETRYRLVRALVAAETELCVCELSPLVAVSDSAISHALSDLSDAGLVARRKEGTWRYYRSTDRAAALIRALDTTRGSA
ncbi:MAG: metalloregulator ArsR/SmtB family transcription factor [Natrialbaceae archaeon]|nr:metalloregulator ArsR/SmtB family transcription factor [Natrialbaceae archaeon]